MYRLLVLSCSERKCPDYGDDTAGKSLIAEYNLLVRKAKSLFKGDSYIQILEEAQEAGGAPAPVMAGKVAALAKGLTVGLESLPE